MANIYKMYAMMLVLNYSTYKNTVLDNWLAEENIVKTQLAQLTDFSLETPKRLIGRPR